jgi:hypothetical protein
VAPLAPSVSAAALLVIQPRPRCLCVRLGTLMTSNKRAGRQGIVVRGDKAMHSVGLARWMALLTAVATASLGCAHTQEPERKIHVISEDVSGVGSDVESGTGGAGAEAYCNELEKQCFKKCWRRKPKEPTIKKGSAVHHEHCTTFCREEFNKCVEELEELERQESQRKELHFPTLDAALGWIREHKTEVALGTIVVVAGVVAAPYVIAIMGGALVLAPL